MESPVERSAGVSASSERKWGLIGGLTGTVAGAGSAVIAIGLDGAAFYETGLYPQIFRSHDILAMDLYMLAVLLTGAGFSAPLSSSPAGAPIRGPSATAPAS